MSWNNDIRNHREKRTGTWEGTSIRKHRAQDKTNPVRKVAENIKSISQRNKDGKKNKWA